MTEKISEMLSREDKIKALKAKINREIEDISLVVKAEMHECLKIDSIENSMWSELINKAYYLNCLSEFINTENRFMETIFRDETADKIVYRVSSLDIDIWLQDDYTFVNTLYYQIASYNGFFHIGEFLNEIYLGTQMISVLEYTIYKKEMME